MASELRLPRLVVIALDERSRCSGLTCESPVPVRRLSPEVGVTFTGTMVVLLTGAFDECNFSSLELEEEEEEEGVVTTVLLLG